MAGSLTTQEVLNSVFDPTDSRLTTDYTGGGGDKLLVETGDALLLETGDNLLLE